MSPPEPDPEVQCGHCQAAYVVKMEAYASEKLVHWRNTCQNCRKQNILTIFNGKVIENEMVPDLEAPAIACVNVPVYLKEYLYEAYRAYAGSAYTATSMTCRLVLDGLLFWLGFQQEKLAHKVNALNGSVDARYGYLQRQMPSLEGLKNMGDFGAHHQSAPSLVEGPTAKGYLQIITGIVIHYENYGRP